MHVRNRDKRDTVPVTIVVLWCACGGAPRVADPGPQVSAVPLTRVPIKDTQPDDDVAVVSEKGHVEPQVVEAAIAPHRSAMTSCYTQKIGRRSWLGGHVVLCWEVAADGDVTSVQIAESDVGAWPIERCLLDIARQVTFGKPVGGGAAEVTLPLELTTARTLASSEEPWAPKAVDSLFAKLDACAKASKVAMPDDVALTIYVGSRRRTESVGFASRATVIDDAWAACAEKAALAWRSLESKHQVTKHLVRYRPH